MNCGLAIGIDQLLLRHIRSISSGQDLDSNIWVTSPYLGMGDLASMVQAASVCRLYFVSDICPPGFEYGKRIFDMICYARVSLHSIVNHAQILPTLEVGHAAQSLRIGHALDFNPANCIDYVLHGVKAYTLESCPEEGVEGFEEYYEKVVRVKSIRDFISVALRDLCTISPDRESNL